jgi:hypothetical protein
MKRLLPLLALGAFFALPAFAEEASPPVQPLGGPAFEGWSGFLGTTKGEARLALPGTAEFRYPDGPRGFYKHGFRTFNDGTRDWRAYEGVRLDVKLPDDRPVELTASVLRAPARGEKTAAGVSAKVLLSGAGWHAVSLPWTAFEIPHARTDWLLQVKGLRLAASRPGGGKGDALAVRDVRLTKGAVVSLEAPVRGKAAKPGGAVAYAVTVGNCTDRPESVELSFSTYGWEAELPTVEPATLALAPGESKPCVVRVKIPANIPPGGHEKQVLQAIANGDAANAARLTFVSAAEVPHPYILHTAARWQEVRDKVKKYPWAKTAQDRIVKQARAWDVPEIAKPPGNDPDDTMGPFLFRTPNENDLLACAYSWQLTRDKAAAEKAATFLRRLSDPTHGYPVTLRGCNQSLVQEGHFFQHIAMAYDMIQDAGVLSDADRAQIESTFRIFLESMNQACSGGAINNWNLSEATGALYCALAMQDLAAADRFFAGPSGVEDQLAKGTMDDGWWYECAISYNMWCASEFTQAALALQPWGYNFKDAWLPAMYCDRVSLTETLSGGRAGGDEKGADKAKLRPFGMSNEIWGPIRRPYRTITDLWNSLLPFIDYRGIMFGVNDSTENQVTGARREIGGMQPFELAYYVYRDPRYASIIKLGGGARDLLYGVPELPEKTPEEYRANAHADNVGLAMLRSQTPGRPIQDQIQAVLHYGTHGWAHGHYDRTDLLSLMRYGRSFWNPESVFWVYEPFLYKFYTQTSLNHNMVVVDEKMQEASPGDRLLFHTGRLMQAAAVETTTRWSNPPYGGMVYDYVPVKTFAEKAWREGKYVPLPKNPPKYGSLTGYTEPVLQRRLMIVTDDYVVLADYLKGAQPHRFECLFQPKGFLGLDGPDKKFLRHDAQWNPDPVGGAQFVTDCDWWSIDAPAVARFRNIFGPGEDKAGDRSIGNTPGVLDTDIYSLWPQKQEIMLAAAPEMHDVAKRVFYAVRGDGKTLAEGKFGAWILGQADIDIPVAGVKQLELETKTELAKQPTLFWANARIITRDGKEIFLKDLDRDIQSSTIHVVSQNIVSAPKAGEDYFGGPIKIAGNLYANGIAAEPTIPKKADVTSKPGLVSVDLNGLDAVRFKATLGGDYPLGPEGQRRKVYAIREPEKKASARFLTLIEPHEGKPVVKSATASGPDQLRVELADGRVQEIALSRFEGSGKDIDVTITETKPGAAPRTETAVAGGN